MKIKITISATLLSVSLLTFSVSSLIAQFRTDIDRNIQSDTLKNSSQNLYFLLNPSIGEPGLKPTYDGSLNPFFKNKAGMAYALLDITSTMFKSHLRGPIYRPSYGPGVPPPFFLMDPRNVTEYNHKIESFKQLSNDSF